MIPRAKTLSFSRAPPENMSNSPKMVPRCWAKKAIRACGVDPRGGDLDAQAIDGQHQQRKQDAPFQLRDLGDAGEG